MRALLITGPGRTELAEVPEPVPAAGEVLLAVEATGLCGTDLHLVHDGGPESAGPLIPGHEVVGTLLELGSGVDDLRPGQRVCVDPLLACGSCRLCRAGRRNLCTRRSAVGITRPGGMAERLAVPAAACWPTTLPPERAVLAEPLACALHGVDRAGVRTGPALVLGAGAMGRLVAAALTARDGAGDPDRADAPDGTVRDVTDRPGITVADISAERVAQARDGGATACLVAELPELPVRRWDLVVDAAGSAHTVALGLARVSRGGTYLQIGVLPRGATVPFTPFDIYDNEIVVTGSRSVLCTVDRAVALLERDERVGRGLVTHRHRLEDAATAFEQLAAHVGVKHVIGAAQREERSCA
ncbi:Threonine dehydrogenase [Actinacidiphila alni]|uniref:2-deoxy-scyllo-inosamine dehydrogenase n=1 Tax=Actinacidiphila alni TaxID=380248 RepID=A0A1I2IDX9_9ACTN|nr:alcohol dehydrogenase catalytic domain-containing protein [Actinacidiphila alni]SFF39297.1 Threonine dehydrogenase [Actinacidiphila alni]